MKGSKTLHNKRHGLGDLQLPVTCDFTPADDPKKDRPKVATKGMDMVTSTVTFTTWGLDSQVLPFQDIFQVSLQNPCLQVGPAPKNHHPVIKYPTNPPVPSPGVHRVLPPQLHPTPKRRQDRRDGASAATPSATTPLRPPVPGASSRGSSPANWAANGVGHEKIIRRKADGKVQLWKRRWLT